MAVITTEGYEMALPGVVITRKAPRHELSVRCRTSPLKPKPGLNGPPAVIFKKLETHAFAGLWRFIRLVKL